ncbi:hypothetical protein RCL_jg1043.t1 [Rhizophagus clarus]|uniref:Uncharacterized protein n=1 Tax=Rhizophagus clarus TaxID=94130 RepID=A0A8H3MA90_9GLOM|nr:hypothetical protein RCL_jg1043.t1 [Rhizophagus clarus]
MSIYPYVSSSLKISDQRLNIYQLFDVDFYIKKGDSEKSEKMLNKTEKAFVLELNGSIQSGMRNLLLEDDDPMDKKMHLSDGKTDQGGASVKWRKLTKKEASVRKHVKIARQSETLLVY